jgi:hypothetical protein
VAEGSQLSLPPPHPGVIMSLETQKLSPILKMSVSESGRFSKKKTIQELMVVLSCVNSEISEKQTHQDVDTLKKLLCKQLAMRRTASLVSSCIRSLM